MTKRQEASARYYLSHRDVCRQRSKTWREKNIEREKPKERTRVNVYRKSEAYRASRQIYTISHREKLNADRNAWRRGNRFRTILHSSRASAKKHEYAPCLLSPEDLERTFTGFCAICGCHETEAVRLRMDHNHETGKFRGWLCHSCNVALGHFHDNQELLTKAAMYLGNNDA